MRESPKGEESGGKMATKTWSQLAYLERPDTLKNEWHFTNKKANESEEKMSLANGICVYTLMKEHTIKSPHQYGTHYWIIIH